MEKHLKTLKIISAWVIASFPAVVISWFMLCNHIDTKAQEYVKENMDRYYPILNAKSEKQITDLVNCSKNQQIEMKEIKSSVKLLVLLEQNRMTWDEKQRIVESLVNDDSLSYQAAYEIVNGR